MSGIDLTTSGLLKPSWTKIGATRSEGDNLVSSNKSLIARVDLRRRSLTDGNRLLDLALLLFFILEQPGCQLDHLLGVGRLDFLPQIVHRCRKHTFDDGVRELL